jgi:putative oxidoreductase
MRTEFMTAVFVLGRLFLGAHFFIAGVRNFLNLDVWIPRMEGRGLPQARPALIFAFTVQTVGGALVATGLWQAVGAAVLIAFTIGATIAWHNFWDHIGEERRVHINYCLTNMALIGGLLIVFATA